MVSADLACVVALKPLSRAKSRFVAVPGPLRRRLVLAMALDTITALAEVAPVIVVTDEPGFGSWARQVGDGVRVVADGQPDLSAAFIVGVRAAGTRRVLVTVADLPCLRAEDVAAVASAESGSWFLADAADLGTTMVLTDAVSAQLGFGPDSAARHVNLGLQPIEAALPTARHDVDTVDDLVHAGRLGVGQWTSPLLTANGLATYQALTVTKPPTDAVGVAVSDSGARYCLARQGLRELARLQPGQLIHAATDGATVRAVWL